MKKMLLRSILSLSVVIGIHSAQAQNFTYFREGFNEGEGEMPSSASASVPGYYLLQNNSGTWYSYGAYRSNGPTGSCQTQGGLSHVRFANLNSITQADDSAYLVTPIADFGIDDLTYLNGRTGRRITIYKTTDTLATTTNWTFVDHFPTSGYSACDMFTVDVNDATARRLKIVARAGTDSDLDSFVMTSVLPILPVKFGTISAAEIAGKVKVNWQILTEENTDRYQIERSADGRTFTAVGVVGATNAGEYFWMDNQPLQGSNLYRIKSIDKDGAFMYSNVIRVTAGKKGGEMNVSPNPVKGGKMNLQLSGMEKGVYTISLFNNVGQTVFNRSIEFNGGATALPLQLPGNVKGGVYHLQLRNGATVITKKVVIE